MPTKTDTQKNQYPSKVVVNGMEFQLQFTHVVEPPMVPTWTSTGEVTTVTILAGAPGSTRKEKTPIAHATATRHPLDTPNRVFARNLALVRALGRTPYYESRAHRKAIFGMIKPYAPPKRK